MIEGNRNSVTKHKMMDYKGPKGPVKDLSGKTLKKKAMDQFKLKNAILDGTTFEDCSLFQARLQGVQGRGVEFKDCDLTSATLFKASIPESRFTHIRGVGLDFRQADCTNAVLNHANISRCLLWSGNDPENIPNFKNATFLMCGLASIKHLDELFQLDVDYGVTMVGCDLRDTGVGIEAISPSKIKSMANCLMGEKEGWSGVWTVDSSAPVHSLRIMVCDPQLDEALANPDPMVHESDVYRVHTLKAYWPEGVPGPEDEGSWGSKDEVYDSVSRYALDHATNEHYSESRMRMTVAHLSTFIDYKTKCWNGTPIPARIETIEREDLEWWLGFHGEVTEDKHWGHSAARSPRANSKL